MPKRSSGQKGPRSPTLRLREGVLVHILLLRAGVLCIPQRKTAALLGSQEYQGDPFRVPSVDVSDLEMGPRRWPYEHTKAFPPLSSPGCQEGKL